MIAEPVPAPSQDTPNPRRSRLPARALSQIDSVDAMNGFALIYESFDPAGEGLREALTSTGNGYLCSRGTAEWEDADGRSEEHTSELQSLRHLVCRLLLEKKK